MKIKLGNTEIEITDTYSDDDIDSINCVAFITTAAMIIAATIWRIFVC